MSGPYDSTTKALIEEYPADWVQFLGMPANGPITVIDADLSTLAAEADKVIRVGDPEPWLLQLELQTSYKTELPRRMHLYNTLLDYRHKQQVRSAVVLLRREADGPAMSGVYERQFPGAASHLTFRYDVVRLWQVPVETLLSGGVGILPLAPLGAVDQSAMPAVIHRVQERLEHETSDEQAQTVRAATYLLMGLSFPLEFIKPLFQGVKGMEESVTYQEILQKGMAKGLRAGKAEGLREGKAEGLRAGELKVILRVGQKQFGAPSADVVAQLEAISDLAQLERLSDCITEVKSWEELLARK